MIGSPVRPCPAPEQGHASHLVPGIWPRAWHAADPLLYGPNNGSKRCDRPTADLPLTPGALHTCPAQRFQAALGRRQAPVPAAGEAGLPAPARGALRSVLSRGLAWRPGGACLECSWLPRGTSLLPGWQASWSAVPAGRPFGSHFLPRGAGGPLPRGAFWAQWSENSSLLSGGRGLAP